MKVFVRLFPLNFVSVLALFMVFYIKLNFYPFHHVYKVFIP